MNKNTQLGILKPMHFISNGFWIDPGLGGRLGGYKKQADNRNNEVFHIDTVVRIYGHRAKNSNINYRLFIKVHLHYK
jgi:hypothetical protein